MDEQRIIHLIKTLDLTREEAIELINEDKKIDRMKSLKEVKSDLTADQQKASKKYSQGDRKKPITFDNKPRERKADEQKVGLIETLMSTLETEGATNIVKTKEGQIDFMHNNRKMRIVLSAPRK